MTYQHPPSPGSFVPPTYPPPPDKPPVGLKPMLIIVGSILLGLGALGFVSGGGGVGLWCAGFVPFIWGIVWLVKRRAKHGLAALGGGLLAGMVGLALLPPAAPAPEPVGFSAPVTVSATPVRTVTPSPSPSPTPSPTPVPEPELPPPPPPSTAATGSPTIRQFAPTTQAARPPSTTLAPATTRPPTTRAPATTRPPTTTNPPRDGVRAGAYCSPAGAMGRTSSGKLMRCTTAPDDSRNRWRQA